MSAPTGNALATAQAPDIPQTFPAGPLPLPGQSAKWDAEAPVAQLDRALPSEGKGHTFESCRVRHHFNGLIAQGY